MARDRTTTSCLALAALVAWTCSLPVFTAPIDAQATAAAGPSFPSEPIWTVDLQATPVGAPLASSDHVFVPLQGSLSARRLADGGEAWLAKLELAGVPAASPDYLIVPAKESLQILRAASGEVVWSERTPAVTAQPLVAGGQLIVATGDTLTSYALADGAKSWTREVGPMDQRPAAADDQLYVPVTDGRLLALNLGTGETIWEADPGINPTEPLIHGDRVYVGTSAKRFVCLTRKTGKEDWAKRVAATVVGPAVTDGTRVYFVALDNLLYALDAGHGALRWKKDLNYRPSAGPTLVGSTIAVPGRFTRMLSFAAVNGAAASPLALTDPLVYAPVFVSATDKTSTRLAVLSGNLENVWKLTLAGPPPPPLPKLTVGPVTVMPGTPVSLPGR